MCYQQRRALWYTRPRVYGILVAMRQIIRVQVQFMREGDTAIVYSPALEISGYGKTLEEAQTDFHHAVKIFMEETAANGTLEKALETLGWKRIDHQWQPQIEILSGGKTEEIALPA